MGAEIKRLAAREAPAAHFGGAAALGALAAGALACGALAIGALAVGRLAIRTARIRRLEIDELAVRSLLVQQRDVETVQPRRIGGHADSRDPAARRDREGDHAPQPSARREH